MAFAGTELSNRILKSTSLRRKLFRLYTQKRKSDRTYKMWGFFNDADADKLIAALKRAGASNPRKVYFGLRISGVRFEYAE